MKERVIVVHVREGESVSKLMCDIFRQFEPRVSAMRTENQALATEGKIPEWPFVTGDHVDGEEG